MYILIIFWWGSVAAQQTHVEFSSIETCNAARREIIIKHDAKVSGQLYTFCVKK